MSNESYLLLITLPVGEFNLRFSPCEKCGLSPPLLSSGKFYVGVKIPRRSFLANAKLNYVQPFGHENSVAVASPRSLLASVCDTLRERRERHYELR
jgi:hypothetical protein